MHRDSKSKRENNENFSKHFFAGGVVVGFLGFGKQFCVVLNIIGEKGYMSYSPTYLTRFVHLRKLRERERV
jgi:hypothetical protein